MKDVKHFYQILSEFQEVNLWVPGHKTKKTKTWSLVSALILLTVLGSIGPVLPGLFNALGLGLASSDAGFQKSTLSSNSTSALPPSVPLPPGTIQYGFHDRPAFGQALDASIGPHLLSTPVAFVYQTSFGIYSFNRSAPFIFALNSISGAQLTTGSFFFVNASVPLTPGTANVTV